MSRVQIETRYYMHMSAWNRMTVVKSWLLADAIDYFVDSMGKMCNE